MIILFGATGDLAQKKLLPALFSMHKKGSLGVPLVCVGRRALTKVQYAELMKLPLYQRDPAYHSFMERLHYVQVDFDRPSDSFKATLEKLEVGTNAKKLIYLAIGEELFPPTLTFLKGSGVLGSGVRVAFEKPFGHDLVSATALNSSLGALFKEEQIYRVDHYLGKDLVDNILAMRFANPLFGRVWTGEIVDNVQIVLSEEGGIESRGEYYDREGAIRDMVQNHIMQILSLVAMESPRGLGAEAIRDAKVAALSKLSVVLSEDCVIGQYDGYHKEPEVARNSETETFVAFKTQVNTSRWKDVPWYIKTGKKLDKKYAEVNLVLKPQKAY